MESPSVPLLDTGDECPGNGILAEQNHAGVAIGKDNMILLLVLREKDADSVIEVKQDSVNRLLRRNRRDFAENALGFRLLRRYGRRRSDRSSGLCGRSGDRTDMNGDVFIRHRSETEVVLGHFAALCLLRAKIGPAFQQFPRIAAGIVRYRFRFTILILTVDIGFLRQERLDHHKIALARGIMQRGVSEHIR